jgi:hypothetical protein
LGRGNGQRSPSTIYHKRLEVLRSRISEFLPNNVKNDDFTENDYPKLLFHCLEKAANITFPSIQNKFLLPLLSTIYQDGQKMITLTGIILDRERNNKKIIDSISNLSFASEDWNKQCEIKVPALTPREILHINSLLPDDTTGNNIEKVYDYFFFNEESTKSIKSYLEFYKYYPNFHHVSF